MGSSRSSVRSRAAKSKAPLVGSEVPRIFTPPLRKLTPKTTLGFALIQFADEVLGTPLLPWQKWLAIHALELLPDGSFRFRTVVLLVARQNGKSTFLQILALFFLYVRGVSLVIGTAQNLDIAEEVWQGAVDIAHDVPDLAEEIEKVTLVNGKKALELRRGERYKVQAANRRGGRGLSGDLVLLDELREHQTWDAWGAVTKTTMARALAQIWAVSNAGDVSSVVLHHLRLLAHVALGDPDGLQQLEVAGVAAVGSDVEEIADESVGIFEWSAVPGCALNDRAGWVAANPSLGHTIGERAIISALTTDPERVFRTEVLCQWVDDMRELVIPLQAWETCRDPDEKATIASKPVFAFDVSPDRSTASVGLAGWNAAGQPHVEVAAHEPGTGWLVAWLVERQKKYHTKVVCDPAGPAGSLLVDAERLGLKVDLVGGREHAQACGLVYDEVMAGVLRHRDDQLLIDALAGASKRPLGEAWLWSRKSSTVNISPLVAITLARGALGQAAKVPAVHGDVDDDEFRRVLTEIEEEEARALNDLDGT